MRSRFAVDSGTKLCCLIGDPISQSPSPGMHNSAFRAAGLNFIYLAFKVSAPDLKDTINGLRAIGVRGINVTIPHKEAASKLVDSLDSISSGLNAINTIVNDDGELYGVNTDIEGFIEPLREKEIPLVHQKCMILGAGGASRACIVGLIGERCTEFTILNRNISRAEKMVNELHQKFDFEAKVYSLEQEDIKREISSADLIVNTTPVGMYPKVSISPITKDLIREDQVIYDIVYRPVKTKLIEYADTAGAKVIHGYEMLVSQAAGSFSLWTGIEAHKSVMRRTVLQLLGV
jgi:shikimate dehydrogenase